MLPWCSKPLRDHPRLTELQRLTEPPGEAATRLSYRSAFLSAA